MKTEKLIVFIGMLSCALVAALVHSTPLGLLAFLLLLAWAD